MVVRRFGVITTSLIFVLLMLACEAASGAVDSVRPAPTSTTVPFSNTTFKVDSGGTYEVHFDVQQGTVIEYSFAGNLDFDFRVLDPAGNVLTKADRVISDSGRVRGDRFGRYTLVFDNGFSLFAGKTVDLRHRVVPKGGR